ncbi:MAG: FtsQ-type POTRA domain-containing protein [Nitrospiraceae bacterium]|nr:MAG: FtsQ-type POTRA domain-containing protein [Nitrospiraceae bacterium]
MRFKKKKKKNGKSASRRGEKMILFFKRGTIVLALAVFVAAAVLGVKVLIRNITVDEIQISGNYHLTEEDILEIINVSQGEQLLDIQFDDIDRRLHQNTWIKSAALRRQFPGRLIVKVDEANPKALLSFRKRMFLIDEDGNILERIKSDATPFLPVIRDINPKNKKEMKEAIKLISALDAYNILDVKESVEIGIDSYGLTATIDGDFIKVGHGRYEEKFARWMELEPEIRKKGQPIQYIDLRFKESVIVKPVKNIRRNRTS